VPNKSIRRIRKPSPAMIVALLALVVAMTGTAVAATTLANGDKVIAKHTLSGNRLRPHTVTGAQIKLTKLGTVPKAKLATTLPPLVWYKLHLINGWTDYDSSLKKTTTPNKRTPAVAVDAQGVVHFRGQITNADATKDQFTTLPAAFRPNGPIYLTADTIDATTGRIDINQDGSSFVETPMSTDSAAGFTSLDGITYALR
jgi:hypothetical protein